MESKYSEMFSVGHEQVETMGRPGLPAYESWIAYKIGCTLGLSTTRLRAISGRLSLLISSWMTSATFSLSKTVVCLNLIIINHVQELPFCLSYVQVFPPNHNGSALVSMFDNDIISALEISKHTPLFYCKVR